LQARLEMMPLGKIKGATRNPKEHDIDGVKASIRRFGFRDFPTLNEATGRLVEGHGRVIALKALKREGPSNGEAWPPENIVAKGKSWHVPIVRGQSWANDREAEAYLAAHNQTTIAGGWIERELALLLRDVQQTPDGLTGLGFDDDYVEGLLRDHNDDVRMPEPSAGPGDPPTSTGAEAGPVTLTAAEAAFVRTHLGGPSTDERAAILSKLGG